jgi:hypothetical protein
MPQQKAAIINFDDFRIGNLNIRCVFYYHYFEFPLQVLLSSFSLQSSRFILLL